MPRRPHAESFGADIAAMVLCLAGLVACASSTPKEARRARSVESVAPSPTGVGVPNDHPLASSQLVSIRSGGQDIYGRLFHAPGGEAHPTAVLAHGFPGSRLLLGLAEKMVQAGWNVLQFHYRGAWGSRGAFSLSHAVEDVAAAVAFLRLSEDPRVDTQRIVLIGHSTGGWASLMAGSSDSSIKAIASLAGFNFGRYAKTWRADPAAREAFARDLGRAVGPIRGTSGGALVAEMAADEHRFDLVTHAEALSSKSLLLVTGKLDSVSKRGLHHDALVRALRSHGARHVTELVLDDNHSLLNQPRPLRDKILQWLALQ